MKEKNVQATLFPTQGAIQGQAVRRGLGWRIRPVTVNVLRCLFVLLSLVAGCLLYVQARAAVLHERYLLEEAQRMQHRIQMENRTLRLTWATLTSPKQLDDVARKRFRLHYPRPSEVVRLQ
jgi:cell division protein FtsL